MSKEFFDYDPLTGVTHYTEQIGDETIVYTEQNLTPLLERNKAIANEGAKDKGISDSWWHYCDVPPVVELALRKKGINIHNPDHGKAMFREINANYPYLKLTHKHHVGT
jgi:hypothetical protein